MNYGLSKGRSLTRHVSDSHGEFIKFRLYDTQTSVGQGTRAISRSARARLSLGVMLELRQRPLFSEGTASFWGDAFCEKPREVQAILKWWYQANALIEVQPVQNA